MSTLAQVDDSQILFTEYGVLGGTSRSAIKVRKTDECD